MKINLHLTKACKKKNPSVSLVMPKCDPQDRFVYPYLTLVVHGDDRLLKKLKSSVAMAIGDNNNDSQYSDGGGVDVTMMAEGLDRTLENDHALTDLTPLQQAAWLGHAQAVQSLLNTGDVDVNHRHSKFGSALHIACYHGYSAVVMSLLQGGADWNQTGSTNQTPVFIAATNGKPEVIQILIQVGSDISICNNEGLSPLHAAVIGNHTEVVYLLLQNGSNVNKQDSKGNLPLHYAVRHKNQELVRYLLDAGSKKDTMNKSSESALHIAIYNSDLDMIEFLLNSGCDVNIQKPDGSGLLHAVVSRCNTSCKTCDIIELLIAAGCPLNMCAYNTLETPLYRALSLKKSAFAQVLVSHGANPNISSPFDVTALHLACKNLDIVTINLLLHSGINWKRERWMDQVSYFQSQEDIEIFQLLKLWRREPMSLVNLSRITLRRYFKDKLVSKIGHLKVPRTVKNFLLFSGVCGWTTDVSSRQYFDKGRNWPDNLEPDVADGPHPDRKSEREDVTV